MDAVREMVTVPASSATTIIQESTNTFNVNQSNNNTQTQIHANTHTGSNNLAHKTTNNVNSSNSSSTSNSNMGVGGSSSSSSCSSSSTSSNSSGYGSSTTTPTNNYELQQTTPTTTPIPTTPILNSEHIIPVATVAAVTPFYNESIATHNLETYHHHHTQQQQQQHHYQYADNHLQTNLQQQHHQYLPRQQYYSPYDYQQTAPTHNLSDSTATPAVAPYNMLMPSPFEMSTSVVAAPSYSAGQYKPSSSIGATGYERIPIIKPNVAPSPYNQQLQQQQQQYHQSEIHQLKSTNQQTHFNELLATSKSRSSSLISGSTNTSTSKPQAAATPFYANPTPFYDNFKHKMPLEYHDTYSNSPPTTVASYHQQQKLYAAVKSQLKEASYGSPAGVNSKSLYANTTNFFPGPTAGLNLSSATYDKYMYSHNSATGYSTASHLGNETSSDVGNYRKSAVGNTVSSSSWPWGVDYSSGNSRSIPPPANHIPTATVAPTHATHFPQNPSVLARNNYYMGHDKYGGAKYDKYSAVPHQQSYVSPPSTNRHLWANTAHTSNLTPLSERHLIPPALPAHGLHTTPYFPNNSTTNLNSRQSCYSQPYQPQSCYYPASHTLPHGLPHNQTPTVAQPTGGYFAAQQPIGQSPHLNALAASCKYDGVLPDYGNGNKMKSSNDLYLNTHHYDNNPASHNFGYGSAHSSQPLYNTNIHQPMTHGATPTSLLTSDPLNANPTSFTNDLSLATSNFDNYHSHFDTHPSQQPITGMHNPQQPPSYGVAVTKRALLDYRKPIQPQPPPTIAEDCYSSLTSRDHYNQQELLNTPETTTIFGEYEAHRNNASSLATEVLTDAHRDKDENSKNLSLRDFIANWNDDEDEYQNNEEMNFDQDTVINEVLQTAPVDQEAPVIAADTPAAVIPIEDVKRSKISSMDTKDNETIAESVKTVENLTATLNDAEANQYVNLPDIVIDIEKSNNVNTSITTPTTSPIATPPIHEVNNTSLSLTNFDVEKELDELNLKKPPAQQNLPKDLNDMKDSKSIITPQLSPCKNLTSQFSFEVLTLETTNKTVLNAIKTSLTTNNNSELNEQCFRDIEGYESSSSRHSNESAFEKEYETFINKITTDSCATKSSKEKNPNDAEMEVDFERNVQDFSKFYKRKRKLKEVELKSAVATTQKKKKLKTTEANKVNKSNFPQAYTKKCRNKDHKTKLYSLHKRKPLSPFYKIIRAIRRFGLYRRKRVREYMTELKDKHLPLIKRQSIKNYAHDITEILFNVKSLKAMCIEVINTDEFRQTLFLAEEQEAEEKHICTDPSCETCDVIRSLMEAESFETTLMQPTNENNNANATFVSEIYCAEDNNGTITILEATPSMNDLEFHTVEPTTMISSENVQYSKETFPAIDSKDLNKYADIKLVAKENVDLDKCTDEISKTSDLDSLRTESNTAININSQLGFAEIDKQNFNFHYETLKQPSAEAINAEIDNLATGDTSENCCELNKFNRLNVVESEAVLENNSLNAPKKIEKLEILDNILLESNKIAIAEIATINPIESKNATEAKQNEESESESEGSESSESDAESNSSSDTEYKSTEDSRDSHKKYNKNNYKKSSDTDIEDLDTETVSGSEDETVNSDSDQSYHSESLERGESSANRKRKETFEAAILYREDKKTHKSSPSPGHRKKHAENSNHNSDHADSTSEDDYTASSPQRIVIRIKKSLSRRDQGLKVENVYEKPSRMQAELNNQVMNETKDGNMATEKSEVVLNNCDLNSKQEENIFENPLDTLASRKFYENDNAEKKSIITPGSLKLVLRRKDFLRDSSFESESEDESSSYKKYKNHNQKSVKEKESIEIHAGKEDIEEICAVITTSPKHRLRKEAEDLEKGLERVDEFCRDKENQSKAISENVKSNAIEQDIGNDETIPVTLEANAEFLKSNVTSEKTSAVSLTHLKPFSTEKKIEHYIANYEGGKPSESHNESEEGKAETTSSFSHPSLKQKHLDEVEKKSLENKSENTIPEAMLSYLTLKPISRNAKEHNAGTECENVLEDQVADEVCDDNLKIKSNVFARSLESIPLPKDLIAEHSSEASELENNKMLIEEEEDEDLKTAKLSTKDDYFSENEAEGITILSPFHILVPIQDDIRKETSSFEHIEIYDLTSSDSEEDEDEDLENETPSQGDVQEINLSSSENSCYFEYESDDENDETLKSNEQISYSNPIVISDDESMDSFNSDEELQTTTKTFRKISAEAVHQIEIDSDFSNSEESQIKENLFFRGKEDEYQKKSKNFQSNELKTTEQVKDLKQSADLSHGSLEKDGYIQCEYNSTKHFFEIEKNLPERVRATEFDNESHYDLNDDKMQKREELQLQDELLTNLDKRYYNKNIEDEVIHLESLRTSEVHKNISEKNSLEENQSVLEAKNSRKKLKTKNYALQKSGLTKTEDLNCSRKKVDHMEMTQAESTSEIRIGALNNFLEMKKINKKVSLPESDITDPVSHESTSSITQNDEHNVGGSIMHDNMLEDIKNTTLETCRPIPEHTNDIAKTINEKHLNEEPIIAERNADTSTESYHSQQYIPKRSLRESAVFSEDTNSNISQENQSLEHNVDQLMKRNHTTDSGEKIILEETKNTTAETCSLTSETNTTSSEISDEDIREISNIPEENEILEHKMDEIIVQDHTTHTEQQTIMEENKTCISTSEIDTKESKISVEDKSGEKEAFEHKIDQDHITDSEENIILKVTKITATDSEEKIILDERKTTATETFILTSKTNTSESEMSAEDIKEYSNIPGENAILEENIDQKKDHTTDTEDETILEDTNSTVTEICVPSSETNTKVSEISAESAKTSSHMPEDHTTESEEETILEDKDSTIAEDCMPASETNISEQEITSENANTGSNIPEGNENFEHKMNQIMLQDHTTRSQEKTILENTESTVAETCMPTPETERTESDISAENPEASSNKPEGNERMEHKIYQIMVQDHITESEKETILEDMDSAVAEDCIRTSERNTTESEISTEDAKTNSNMPEESEDLEHKMDQLMVRDPATDSEEEDMLEGTESLVTGIFIPTSAKNTTESEISAEDAKTNSNMPEENEDLEHRMDQLMVRHPTTDSEEDDILQGTDSLVAENCISTSAINTKEVLEHKMDQIMLQDHTTESEEETILEDTESTVAETSTLTCITNIPQDGIEDILVSNKKEDHILNAKERIVQIPSVERDINVRTMPEEVSLIKSRKLNKTEDLVDVSHNTTSATFKVHSTDNSLSRDCKAVSESEIEENVEDTRHLEEPISEPQTTFEVLNITANIKEALVETENCQKITEIVTEVDPNCTDQVHNKEVFAEISSPNQANNKTEAYNVESELDSKKFDGTAQVHNKKAFEEVYNENEITAQNKTEETEIVSETETENFGLADEVHQEKICDQDGDETTTYNKTEALETKLNVQIENCSVSKFVENFTNTAAEKSETLVQAIPENPDMFENKQMENTENISNHGNFIDKHKVKTSICKQLVDEVKKLEDHILDGSFHGSENEQSATSFEPNPKCNVILSSESELTYEIGEETNTANNREEDELLSTNILTAVSQVDINILGEVPKAFNHRESCVSSGRAVLEKLDTKEEKFDAELKNSNNSKKVTITPEEAFVVDNENSFQAEEEVTRSGNIEISASYEEPGVESSNQSNNKLDSVKPLVEEKSVDHQPEHSNLSSNDTSSQNIVTKDCSTSGDLSTEFLGFKNQSSFEDESEDFHGFEDLEEVTRIRQEIENLNDDCAANDGFLNNLTPNTQPYKSSTTSLTDSTSSEINELEALEKELSQHQQKIPTDEDDVKETEQNLPMQPIEIASSNDIEHIKQMLESDEEQQTDAEDKIENLAHKICKAKSVASSNNISKDTLSSVNSIIPKLSDLSRAALNSSLNSNSNLAQQHTPQTSTVLVEHELSVEEALAEMFRQAGVLLSDPEDCDNDIPSPGQNETQTHDVLLINLQEILNSDNNDVYVLQCNMNENILNVVQSAQQHEGEERKDKDPANTERVNTVQIILNTQNPEPQIHIISSDSESEVIILSDDDSEFSYRPFSVRQERVAIPFINDGDINNSNSSFDISTIHHEEIVPDNLDKFLEEEFYKYLHEKYVQRNISKYYHANRILRKYKKRLFRSYRQLE